LAEVLNDYSTPDKKDCSRGLLPVRLGFCGLFIMPTNIGPVMIMTGPIEFFFSAQDNSSIGAHL
jgi:hypothetical protein